MDELIPGLNLKIEEVETKMEAMQIEIDEVSNLVETQNIVFLHFHKR